MHKLTFIGRTEIKIQPGFYQVCVGDMGFNLNQATAEPPANPAARPHAHWRSQANKHTGITDILTLAGDRACPKAEVERVFKTQSWPAVGKFLDTGQNTVSLKRYSIPHYSQGVPIARTSSVLSAGPIACYEPESPCYSLKAGRRESSPEDPLDSSSPSAIAPAQSYPAHRESKRTQTAINRVLIVDDDEILSRFLERILREDGYDVEFACNGADALHAFQADFDLVILDLNLPKIDGISVLRQMRPKYPKLPVLVLTGRIRSESAIEALENGADDCLNKPFSYLELLARVRALLRRNTGVLPSVSTCGDLILSRPEMRVERNGQRVELTGREYGLIEYLMRTPRIPINRATLLKEVWGADFDASTNIVDVYMKYVRDKIDVDGLPKLIRTIRGVGYAVSED